MGTSELIHRNLTLVVLLICYWLDESLCGQNTIHFVNT